MSNKMIFFDIDGTLLDHDKKLPESTIQAVQALRDAGHAVAIATGRGPFMFKSLREQLQIDSFVSFNGQYVEYKGEPIYKNPINPDVLHSFSEHALRNGHPLVYMTHDTMRSNVQYHAYVAESFDSLMIDHPEHDPDYHTGRDVYQTLVFCNEEEETEYKNEYPQLDFIRWHPVSADILPAGGSKARGIEKMISMLGIDKSDVYAFGDYLNDIEMLQFVGNGIAMGNAHESVKQVAKYVTKDVGEDGIMHGLQLVGLL